MHTANRKKVSQQRLWLTSPARSRESMNLTYYDKSPWIPASWEAQVDTSVDRPAPLKSIRERGGGEERVMQLNQWNITCAMLR